MCIISPHIKYILKIRKIRNRVGAYANIHLVFLSCVSVAMYRPCAWPAATIFYNKWSMYDRRRSVRLFSKPSNASHTLLPLYLSLSSQSPQYCTFPFLTHTHVTWHILVAYQNYTFVLGKINRNCSHQSCTFLLKHTPTRVFCASLYEGVLVQYKLRRKTWSRDV